MIFVMNRNILLILLQNTTKYDKVFRENEKQVIASVKAYCYHVGIVTMFAFHIGHYFKYTEI